MKPGGLNIRKDFFDIIPFVILFSHQGRTIAKLAKAIYKLLHSAYPGIYTPRFITAFSKNKNLKDMLVSTKLQRTMDFYVVTGRQPIQFVIQDIHMNKVVPSSVSMPHHL